MIAPLEYINLVQFYKQIIANIWVGLSPVRPILGYLTTLNDVDNIIITTEILYEVYLNSCKWWACLLSCSVCSSLYLWYGKFCFVW